MPTAADHAILVLLALLFPAWAALFGMRRLRRATAADQPRERLWLYRRAIAIQWTVTALVLAHWLAAGRSMAALGLVPAPTPGLGGVLLGTALVVGAILRRRREALEDDETLERVSGRLGRLELVLPHDRRELTWFYRLSITAGICEEVLYRGFLIWYLGRYVGLLPAAAGAAFLFGVGHAYQGARGILTTGAVGLFLGGVYLVTGSLFAGMLLHALMDLHSGHVGYVALRRRAERAAAAAGAGEDPGEPPAGAEDAELTPTR